MHLKREPNFCFVNNYFDVGLTPWQANMNIQTVFNKYKVMSCICRYLSKSDDQCSQAMKQADNEGLENKRHNHNTMKTIAKA